MELKTKLIFVTALSLNLVFFAPQTVEAKSIELELMNIEEADIGCNDGMNQLRDIVGQGISVLFYLSGSFFTIRMVYLLINSQIDLLFGKPGAVADMVQEMMFAILSFTFASFSPRFSSSFACMALDYAESLGSGGFNSIKDTLLLMQPLFTFVYSILVTILVSNFLVGMTMNGLRTVSGNFLGSPQAISQGIVSMGSIVLSLVIGFSLIRVGGYIYHLVLSTF